MTLQDWAYAFLAAIFFFIPVGVLTCLVVNEVILYFKGK
jgi:hypothetical protein